MGDDGPSVRILHSGGHYPRVVERYLISQGALVTSHEAQIDEVEAVDAADSGLPDDLGGAEVLIAIALSAGVVTALPRLLAGTACRALLVPIECPTWGRHGLARQVQQECARHGLECAVPTPFCALAAQGGMIGRFCARYSIGRPRFELEVSQGVVRGATCIRGAACGLTHWVAERLIGVPASEAAQHAGRLHHMRPCFASMVLVPETGDTLMHASVAAIERAVANAARRAGGGSVLTGPP